MENLGIDTKLIVAQLINFALFAFVFKKYLAKPFQSFVAKEKLQDEQRERVFAEANKMEEKLQKREADMSEKAKKEYAKLMTDAKAEVAAMRAQMVGEAQAEAVQIREKAKAQIEAERAELQQSARDQIRELSFYLVNTSLKDVLSDDMKKKVTESIVKNAPKSITLHS